MGRKKKDDSKVKELLSSVLKTTASSEEEMQIKNDIGEYIKNNYSKDENFDTYSFSLFVKSNAVTKWKTKDHFSKVFNDEIKYIKTIYGLSKGESNLLNSLPSFLMWETNLLVNDETLEPLNQQMLADLLEVDRKTINRNIKGLIDKQIIYEIKHKNSKFYIMNPYVMYAGRFINQGLVDLFNKIGYVDLKTYNKLLKNK